MAQSSFTKRILEQIDSDDELGRRLLYARLFLYAAIVFVSASCAARLLKTETYTFHSIFNAAGPSVFIVLFFSSYLFLIDRYPKQILINILLLLSTFILLALIFLRGGILSPFIAGIPLLIFLAAFISGPSYTAAISLISLLSYIIMVFGQSEGWLPQTYPYHSVELPYLSIIIVSASYIISGFVAWAFSVGFERRRHARESSERRYRFLLDRIPDPVLLFDNTGTVRHANPAALEKFGYASADLVGSSGEILLPPGKHLPNWNKVKEDFRSGRAVIFEADTLAKSGWQFPVEIHASPVIEDHAVTAVIAIFREITERKKVELALREGERFLSSVFSSIQDGISILDKDLNILRTNPIMEQWYSHNMPLIGKKCYDAYHGKSAPCDVCPTRKTLESGKLEIEIVPKTGPGGNIQGWLDLYSFPLVDSHTGEMNGVIEYVRDISDKKKAEEALRESEELYRSLTEAAQDYIFVVDRDLRVKFVNNFCASKFNAPLDKIIGKRVSELFSGPTAERQERHLREVIQSGNTFSTLNYSVFPNGTFWLSTKLIPLKDEKGDVVEILGISRDFTEQRNAEEALRSSEERYRRLVETSPDAIIVTDLQTRIIMANNKTAELYGTDDVSDLIGRNSFDLIVAEDRDRAIKNAQKTYETGRISKEEYRLIRKDGSNYIGEISAAVLTDADGNPINFLGVLRDITEQKLAELAIKESEERFRTLADATFETIVIHDKGKFLDVNRAALKMFGITREDTERHDIFKFIHPDSRDLVKGHVQSGFEGPYEAVCVTKDGTPFPVEATARMFPYKGRTVRVVSMRDISDRKRAEEQRKKYEEQLILSDRMASLGGLVKGIAHEFNNIFAGMRGYAQVSQLPNKENRLRELPDLVIDMVDRAQKITENLLSFSERFQPSSDIVRPAQMIEGILNLLRKDIESSGIEVKVDIPEEFTLRTDGGKIQQVLLNLISNARHAMQDGGLLSFSLREGDGAVRITVSDTGTGIPKDSIKHIFEPFFTTKGPLASSSLPGTGLGLSLSYGIMQSLGGNIEVESESGRGSTFSIVLPTDG